MTQKGFFESLFDISFSSLITTRIIKVVYVIFLVVLGLVAILALITGIARGGGSIIATIIIVPIAFLLYTIFFRIYLEIVIVLFRIMETNQELVELARGQAPGGAPPTAPMSSPPPPAA
ncbi:MAG TPA: DUF4282 domain-containing protein [Solirubrobacteraceae bacterium]